MVRHEKAGNIAQHFWTLLNEIVKIFAFANTHKYGTKMYLNYKQNIMIIGANILS